MLLSFDMQTYLHADRWRLSVFSMAAGQKVQLCIQIKLSFAKTKEKKRINMSDDMKIVSAANL